MNLLALIQRLRTLDLSAQPQLEAKLRWMLLDSWACAVAGSRAAPVAALAARLPPFVTPVLLYVNAPAEVVAAAGAAVRPAAGHKRIVDGRDRGPMWPLPSALQGKHAWRRACHGKAVNGEQRNGQLHAS